MKWRKEGTPKRKKKEQEQPKKAEHVNEKSSETSNLLLQEITVCQRISEEKEQMEE